MGRRWVGVEQMDYINTTAKKRLVKVIEGEQGGISQSEDWQGLQHNLQLVPACWRQ